MSVFDLPRIHFAGHLRLNPATANNEDYAQPGDGQAYFPDGPYEGSVMGLLSTRDVKVRQFGMSDADFVEWVQQRQTFMTGAGDQQIIPAEWNYYGDMSAISVDVAVTGVQVALGTVLTAPDPSIPLTALLGAALTWTGTITDINPEGDPPATQFFIDNLRLANGTTSYLSGADTSKGAGVWINFFRNAALPYDDGSGTYVQHVITGGQCTIPGLGQVDGLVWRYTLALPLLDDPTTNDPAVLEQYYRDRRANPKTLEIAGTLAPYHAGDPIAMPPGRQLISRTQNLTTPKGTTNNGGGLLALAPCVANQQGDWLSIDLAGTFPEIYNTDGTNPKWDFGPVTLCVGADPTWTPIATLPYADTARGVQSGWVFDLDLDQSQNPTLVKQLLADGNATLQLQSQQFGVIAEEVDYYVVTDHLAVYAEQGGPDDEFFSQGKLEPISVGVYHRGERLDAASCPPISMWQYRTAPIQDPGDAVSITTTLQPDTPITVATDRSGASVLTFLVSGERNPPSTVFPPADYGAFGYPPQFAITWAPQISVRVLPNEDYSKFYVDPTAPEPVGNDLLTWDVVYSVVLRTYALLYPAMNNKIRLDDEGAMRQFASYIIDWTQPDRWMSSRYMPPTRDLSASRRTLLQAWCRKVGG